MVVICLQNVSLMCWVTTVCLYVCMFVSLWFAYKMYLWCVELQPSSSFSVTSIRCDLLTKCIFDVLSYNKSCFWSKRTYVVICLQNVSLMCWVTTVQQKEDQPYMLWFAYKMYLWCVELQRKCSDKWYKNSCDLLTKCIFDVLSYNFNSKI